MVTVVKPISLSPFLFQLYVHIIIEVFFSKSLASYPYQGWGKRSLLRLKQEVKRYDKVGASDEVKQCGFDEA